MSGGAFNYQESRLADIADELEDEINNYGYDALTDNQKKKLARLATHLRELKEVLRIVDYSFSGDKQYDAWEEECKEFLETLGV